MAKKSSKSKSSKSKRKSTGGSTLTTTLKQAGVLSAIGVGLTMADRYREGKTLNPFTSEFWA